MDQVEQQNKDILDVALHHEETGPELRDDQVQGGARRGYDVAEIDRAEHQPACGEHQLISVTARIQQLDHTEQQTEDVLDVAPQHEEPRSGDDQVLRHVSQGVDVAVII